MTYQEIKERLSKCELTLSKLQDNSNSSLSSDNKNKVKQLTMLKESLQKQLNEADKGVITTDDEDTAKDLADKGSNVKLTVKERLQDVFPNISDALSKVGDKLGKMFSGLDDLVGKVGKGLLDAGKGLIGFVKNPIEGLQKAYVFLSIRMNSLAQGFMAIGKRMIKGLKNFAMSAYTFLATGLKSMATGFVTIGKQFIRGAIRLAVSAATMVAGMLATAASVLISGLVMMAPAILIGLAVAALIFGVMYLAKKFEENKEMIMFK